MQLPDPYLFNLWHCCICYCWAAAPSTTTVHFWLLFTWPIFINCSELDQLNRIHSV